MYAHVFIYVSSLTRNPAQAMWQSPLQAAHDPAIDEMHSRAANPRQALPDQDMNQVPLPTTESWNP